MKISHYPLYIINILRKMELKRARGSEGGIKISVSDDVRTGGKGKTIGYKEVWICLVALESTFFFFPFLFLFFFFSHSFFLEGCHLAVKCQRSALWWGLFGPLYTLPQNTCPPFSFNVPQLTHPLALCSWIQFLILGFIFLWTHLFLY